MRIYKRKNSWYLDYTYKGKRIRKSVGRSKKVAELTLKDIEVKIAKEEQLGIHDTKKILLTDFAEEYLKFSKTNKAPQSHRRDIVSLRVNLMPYFKEQYLKGIDPETIEKYKTERLGKVKPATVNRELACLKNLFNKSIEWGYCNVNPVKKVKLLKEPPGRIRYLENYEIHALLKECSLTLKPIVIVALNTGMRKSELLNLKWRDVSSKDRMIIVKNSKNNESRIIPMNEDVYSTLRELYHPENNYVFLTKKGSPYKEIKKGFKSALKRAGIDDFRFHDLRHTFASHLAMNGWNLQTIQRLMGHKDFKMTLRYSHLTKSHLQDAVNSLGKSFRVGTNLAQLTFLRESRVVSA